MALGKWLPCAGRSPKGKSCREQAKYLGVEEDDEGGGAPLLVPVCEDHTHGYDRLREITAADTERFGRM